MEKLDIQKNGGTDDVGKLEKCMLSGRNGTSEKLGGARKSRKNLILETNVAFEKLGDTEEVRKFKKIMFFGKTHI